MKRFSFQLPLLSGILLGLMFFAACKKEAFDPTTEAVPSNNVVTSRGLNGLIAGITVYAPGNPSQLVVMDDAAGGVQYAIPVVDVNNQPLDDIKGICLAGNNRYYISTGINNILSTSNNTLFALDITTGVATPISGSTVGTVSDIDYNPADGNLYGLADNNNRLIRISNSAGPFTFTFDTYAVVGNITGIAFNHTAKGLTVIRDASGVSLKVAATTPAYNFGGNCTLYDVPFTAGAATFVANLLPNVELQGGHCAIGYDADISRFQVNRQAGPIAVVVPGLNITSWPLPTPANTFFWGGVGFNFEDITSKNY
jgi:hypothetical protein